MPIGCTNYWNETASALLHSLHCCPRSPPQEQDLYSRMGVSQGRKSHTRRNWIIMSLPCVNQHLNRLPGHLIMGPNRRTAIIIGIWRGPGISEMQSKLWPNNVLLPLIDAIGNMLLIWISNRDPSGHRNSLPRGDVRDDQSPGYSKPLESLGVVHLTTHEVAVGPPPPCESPYITIVVGLVLGVIYGPF